MTQRSKSSPSFQMPAEWYPHRQTWMAWPFDDSMWFGQLAEVRQEYATLVKAISQAEPVQLFVRDEEAAASAASHLASVSGVTLHQRPLDDVWMRDSGPTFLHSEEEGQGSSLVCGNWRFNAWGEKYDWLNDDKVPEYVASILGMERVDINLVMEGGSLEVDGRGLCLTTEQCLLSPNRNPTLAKDDVEVALQHYLGVNQVIWLRQGLEGDHTDGHIDTITRFSHPGVVLTSVTDDTEDPNYDTMLENLEILRTLRLENGDRLAVIELPLPRTKAFLEDGTRLPSTYANFYIANGLVVVPQYDDPHDQKALAIVTKAFPHHRVVGLMSRHIIKGGGSFHCLTQQQPEGGITR